MLYHRGGVNKNIVSQNNAQSYIFYRKNQNLTGNIFTETEWTFPKLPIKIDSFDHYLSLKKKDAICLGMIAQAESISGSELIRQLELRNNVALRPWLRPLIEIGVDETNDTKTKGVEYRVNPHLLRDSDFKSKTTLKRIEPSLTIFILLLDLIN